MKQKKATEITRSSSEISSAIDELSVLVFIKPGDNHEDALIPTKPFLSLCYSVLQVLDKIGPTMAVLRQDIHQNIKRLEMVLESNSSLNSNLVEILKAETREGSAKKGASCSKAFVWLTRSLDFASALLQTLSRDSGENMEEAVEEAYNITLKPWHGWISSAAFRVTYILLQVSLKLVPDSKTFIDILKANDESCDTQTEKIEILVSLLAPFLEGIHSVLKAYGLENLKSI